MEVTHLWRSTCVTATTLFIATIALAQEKIEVIEPETVGMSSARLAKLTETFENYVENGDLAGAVILVGRDGEVPYFEVFGQRDIEGDAAMTDDTIFRIASQTKAIVSAAVMMLQEDGELLISDPVGKYLPEFMETTVAVPVGDESYALVPAERAITIRDLLTHTSGISYGDGPAQDLWAEAGFQGWYFGHFNEPIRDLVRRMASLPADAQPGSAWIYGYNTDILGALVEEVSGTTLDAFLAERMFEPLGMTDTHFYLPAEKSGRLATLYSRPEPGGLSRAPDESRMDAQGEFVDGPRIALSGGAGLLSTPHDYFRFLEMLSNGGLTRDGEQLLSPKSIELMTVSHTGNLEFRPGTGFGLGFEVVEDLGERGKLGSEGEFRWGGAYGTTYWIDPVEDLIVAYFTQIRPKGDLDDQEKLRTLIYQAITDSAAEEAS
jgi:CubicO group peptidase (beta-lactamase class C family)